MNPVKFTLLFVLLNGLTSFQQQLTAQSRPNIVFIYADDLGYGELGCYGQQKIQTPHIDQLASGGIRFTQHYSGAPVCAPARAMLMTGLHSGHSPIRGNFELGGYADSSERGQQPLPALTFTMAGMLKKAGYATAAIGKWGLGMFTNEGNPNQQGFDYFYGYLDQKQAHNYYPTHLWENGRWDTLRNPVINVHRAIDSSQADDRLFDYYKGNVYAPAVMTEKAVEFMTANRSKPFFLYLPYTLPHLSLQVPDAELNFYRGKWQEQPYYGQKGYAPHRYPLSAYAAMISYLDKQVGIIMEVLQRLQLDKNTLVVFTSDNGGTFDVGGAPTRFFNSNGILRGNKGDVFEGGIRVPLVVSWPGKIRPGAVSHHLSAQYDWLATLADITGQSIPGNDGISLLPTLLGKESFQQQHTFLYFEFPETGGQIAIRLGNWKGVKRGLKKNPAAPWMLFDLETDPSEATDLSGRYPAILLRMEAIIQQQHMRPILREWELVDK